MSVCGYPRCTRWPPNWWRTATSIDVDVLRAFVSGYQKRNRYVSARSGDPDHARMALVERLGCCRRRAARARRARAGAGDHRAIGTTGRHQADDYGAGAQNRAAEAFTPPFVVELLRGLRDRPRRWRRHWEQCSSRCTRRWRRPMIRQEAQLEASMQVSIGNAITSMRKLSAWMADFVEHVAPRARAARGRRALRADGLRHARSLSTVGGTARATLSLLGGGGGRRRVRGRPRTSRGAGCRAAAPRGYYLISRGRFELETTCVPAAQARAVCALLSSPGRGLSRPRRDLTVLGVGS